MPKKMLTARTVQNIKSPLSGRVEYFDKVMPGFALRVTDKGTKSWVLFLRLGGRLRRFTIGTYPNFSLAEAREEARKALQMAEKGEDPIEAKLEAKRQLKNPDTVEAVVDAFIEKHHKRDQNNRTAEEVRRMFERHVLPDWGRRDISKITKRDVLDLLDAASERTSPVRANRVFSNVRKLFVWCAERDIVEASPVVGIKRPGKEIERDRVLSDDEIRLVWSASEQIGWPFGQFTKMLLVTAQRRDEVAHMRWDDIEAGIWRLPREITKSDRSHEVPLSRMALEILDDAPRLGPYVFMSGRKPRLAKEFTPISGFGKAKERLDKLSGVTDWRYHDLRRTAGTNMARLQVPLSTISRVLNHAEGGVTKIYARHSFIEEKRRALDTWAHALEAIVRTGDVANNVVMLGDVS